jgi:peptidoglycan hydrolase CwlO-like protein
MAINCSSKIRKEPKHTCPLIDSVIEILEEQFGKKDGSIDTMEEIRDNCSSLRCWGDEWKEYAEYCEENSEHYEKKYEQSEEENSDKTEEIIQLQKKIDELESKISDLKFDLNYTN